jgi:hypothetical protein
MSYTKRSIREYVRTRKNWASAHTEELVSSALAQILVAERDVFTAYREVCIARLRVEDLAREDGWTLVETRYPTYDWRYDQYVYGGGLLAAVLRKGHDIVGYADNEGLSPSQMARVAAFIDGHKEAVGAVGAAHDAFLTALHDHARAVEEAWAVIGGPWHAMRRCPGADLPWAPHQRGALDPGVI